MIHSSQFFIFFVLKSCFHLNVENLFPLTDHDANDDAPHQGEEYRGEEVCEHWEEGPAEEGEQEDHDGYQLGQQPGQVEQGPPDYVSQDDGKGT